MLINQPEVTQPVRRGSGLGSKIYVHNHHRSAPLKFSWVPLSYIAFTEYHELKYQKQQVLDKEKAFLVFSSLFTALCYCVHFLELLGLHPNDVFVLSLSSDSSQLQQHILRQLMPLFNSTHFFSQREKANEDSYQLQDVWNTQIIQHSVGKIICVKRIQ